MTVPRWARFWDIDRVLLLLTLFLIAIGLIAVAAASPATAMRYSGEHRKFAPLYYFWRQVMWVGVSLPVLFGVSMLPVVTARRMAVLGTGILIAIPAVTPFIGVEINGARRWIGFGIAQFQPSEFLADVHRDDRPAVVAEGQGARSARDADHHGHDRTGRRAADAATRFRTDDRFFARSGSRC